MYKTFTLPLKSAFALSAFFILTACGGFTIDINLPASTDCFANPFVTECDQDEGVDAYRKSLISNCADNPNRADTELCRAADAWVNPPSDDENGAEVVDNTPKDIEIKSEFNKNSLTKTDKEKIETTSLEIVDFCIDPANAKHARCSPEVIDCINNPFSGSCEDNNLLGNFVRGGVTVSKTVVLQDKRAVDCRDGNVDRAQCQTLNSEKQRCTGAAFSDASCSAVTHSVCKADAFDPLCDGDANYEYVRANACETDPAVSSSCPVVDVCLDNPFGLTCTDSVYNNARRDLVKICAIQAVTGAVTSACDTIIAEARPCLINPFDTACDANPAVRSHIGLLRSSRVALCKNDTRIFDRWIAPLCTGAPVAKSVCAIDPFNTVCLGDSAYAGDRLSACRDGSATTGQCGNIIAGVCGNNPFDSLCGSGYTQNRRALCLGDPFTPRCAGDVYDDLRVNFCDVNAGTHPSCPPIDTTPNQVTATVWADSFDEPLATAASRDHRYSTESQFLIGRATDLDDGGIGRYGQNSGSNTGFTLADATFNGVALGGDATDGVAFFSARGNSYAGVLSDTNLGAPLTDTTGSAKWIGSFQLGGFDPIDFVLTVSFGTGTRAGEVEALVQKYSYYFDHYIKGEFDDTGVITGTAYQGIYRTPDPANRGIVTHYQDSGKLTGLIGEEGAVGAFLIDRRGGYSASGGFVARPSSEAELATLEQTCANDPFNKLCTIGYESERNARIEHCIIGGNANDGICRSANQLHICIKHPFRAGCNAYLSQYYEQARANREAFCRTAGNAGNELCTSRTTVSYICTNYPFDAACLGDDRFTRLRKIACSDDPFATRCAGDVYNNVRVRFCAANAGNPACPTPEPTITEGATPQVTAEVWVDSFEQPLSHGATASDRRTQFLIGKETDLDRGGLGVRRNGAPNYSGTTTLATATFNGVALGGDAADGISYFAAAGSWSPRYAGILSGTNLGAPLTDTQGSAKWIGSFILEGHHPADFVLNISFGTGDGVGEVEGFAQRMYDYHIHGEFDTAGVITGTSRWGTYKTYKTNNVGWEIGSGKLTGLIGEEGAVGAFFISGYYGGFVARPPTAKELQDLTQTCNDNPFNRLCDVGYESQRNALIEHCIIGGNGNDERCDSVDNRHPCIRDPFGRCGSSFLSDYEQLRANRLAFCRTAGNANNALCTVEATYHYICTNHPFDAQCLSNNDYTQLRRTTCLDDPFTTRCTGDVYNDLRVTFCTRNAGTHPACPRPVVPDTTPNRVTAADWLASFDGGLPKSADLNDSAGSRFIESKANDLDTGGMTTGGFFAESRKYQTRVYNLNFDTATFSRQYLNGDGEDGVAFFSGSNNDGETISYAGILSGTDLGAPVNQTGRATWNGQIANTVWKSIPKDFSLNIDFDGQGQGGSIEGFSQLYSSRGIYGHIDLAGRFDANGVISGTVKQGNFAGYTRNSLIDGYEQAGVLTGLIGQEGAVGAFIFERDETRVGWAGGFVVRPSEAFIPQAPLVNNAQVTTADWLASVKQGLYSMPYQFIEASKTGLSIINDNGADHHVLTLADSTFDGRDLGGDRADGVAFSRGKNSRDWHMQSMGVLSGSDLGVPLTQQQGTVYWEGKIIALSGINEIFKDFKLQINFGQGDQVGTISAFVAMKHPDLGHHYRLDGSFDTNGVIKGTTESGMFMAQDAKIPQYWRRSGTLTGLIGEEGAVGAFFSNRGGSTGYVGGFVAKPNVTPATIPTPVAVTPVDRVTKDVWLSTLGKQEISSDTPYITAQSNFSSGLGIDGEANNGFFFKDSSGSGFSEILSGTDLGAPLTQTTGSLRWNGLFVSGRDGWTTKFFRSDFVLEVSFGGPEGYAGRIDAIFEMYTTRSANLAIYLRGVFDDNGVISGRILYGSEFLDIRDTSTDYQSFQSLTGLIGQKGAVGVIDPSPGYTAAGFIASPKSTIDLVHYADWKVPFLKKVPELASYNQFIASTQGGLDVGDRLKNADGTAAVVNTLNFNSADNIDGGVAFTSGFISGKKGFFATVLDTVNLGEPVTLTSGSAIWQGKFKAVIGDRIVNKDLDLTVDFGNERISAGVQDTGNYYLSIDGSYNENGFIEGTTSYGTSSVNSDGSRDLPGTNGNVGTLKGLIGQKGAVGAFISKDNAATRNSKNTIGYSGGFVAAPPSQ